MSKKSLEEFFALKERTKLNSFKIHFIRIISIRNAGDMACGPYMYFKEFTKQFICTYHDLRNIDYNDISNMDLVIIGAGGVLDVSQEYVDSINMLMNKCKNVIAWSVGHNRHYDCNVKRKINYDKFLKLTVRDYNYPGQRYLPCVTCMMTELDRVYEIKRRIGIIEHTNFPIREFPYERISNSCAIENIIEFIGNSEIIITNSYHCYYWSILMKRRVILYNSFSEKFDYIKQPVVKYSGNLEEDIAATQIYESELQKCRLENIKFANEVLTIAKELKRQQNFNVNYEYEIRQCFDQLFKKELADKKCAIYGAGITTKYLEEFFHSCKNVVCITGKEKKYEFEIPYVTADRLDSYKIDCLLVSVNAHSSEILHELLANKKYQIIDIYSYLENNGIILERDFYSYFSRVAISI